MTPPITHFRVAGSHFWSLGMALRPPRSERTPRTSWSSRVGSHTQGSEELRGAIFPVCAHPLCPTRGVTSTVAAPLVACILTSDHLACSCKSHQGHEDARCLKGTIFRNPAKPICHCMLATRSSQCNTQASTASGRSPLRPDQPRPILFFCLGQSRPASAWASPV